MWELRGMPADGGGGNDGDVRLEGDRVASDFICDDGQPSGDVCRCRLLFWCRFRTRKVNLLAAPRQQRLASCWQSEGVEGPDACTLHEFAPGVDVLMRDQARSGVRCALCARELHPV